MSYVRVVLDSPTPQFFTYRVSPATLTAAEPGALVEVPIGPRTGLGIVFDRVRGIPSELKEKLRPIGRVLSPGPWAPPSTLKLTRALADYSGEPFGVCLFRLLPPAGKGALYAVRSLAPRVTGQALSLVGSHAERLAQYVTLSTRAQKAKRQIILIAPLVRHAQLREKFTAAGLRVSVVSANFTPSKQRQIAQALATGVVDVLITTRHALGWSVYALGLLIVDDPLHQAHIDPQRPYLDAATIAYLRHHADGGHLLFGLRAPIPALAARSTIHPITTRSPRPIRFVRPSQRGLFSPTLVADIERALRAGSHVRIVAPRHGLGSHVRCRDCDRSVRCPKCQDEVSARSPSQPLSCPSCSTETPWPAACKQCQGNQLAAVGIGDEAIRTWLRRHEPTLVNRVEVVTEGTFDLPTAPPMLTIFAAADSPLSSPDLLRPARYLGAVREALSYGPVIVETRNASQPWFGLIGSAANEAMTALLAERACHHVPPYERLLRVLGPREAELPITFISRLSYCEYKRDRTMFELTCSVHEYLALRAELEIALGRGWKVFTDSILEQAVTN